MSLLAMGHESSRRLQGALRALFLSAGRATVRHRITGMVAHTKNLVFAGQTKLEAPRRKLLRQSTSVNVESDA